MFHRVLLASAIPCLLGIASGGAQSPSKSSSTLKDYHGDPLPAGALARFGSWRMRLDGGFTDVAFSPDQRVIAVAGSVITKTDGRRHDTKTILQLWDVDSGRMVRDLEADAPMRGLVYADGKTLAALSSSPPALTFWSAASGKKLPVQVKLEGIDCFALAPGGKLAALAISSGTTRQVVLWDLIKQKELARLDGHKYGVQSLAFSADGKLLTSVSIAVNFNNQALPGQVILWDVAKAAKIREIIHDSSFVVLSRDGSLAAWASRQANGLMLADVRSKREHVAIAGDHHSFLFSPDNKTLATGSQRGIVSFWDTGSGKELHRLEGHISQYSRILSYSGDGKLLATGNWDRGYWGSRRLRIWDAKTGKEINPAPMHADRITSVAYSRDGRVIASGSIDKSIRLWQATTGKPLHLLSGHEESITALVFAPDGKTLASAAADKTVRFWDLSTGKEKSQHADLSASVLALAFSPDGKTLLAAAADGSVISWQGDESKTSRLLNKGVLLNFAALTPDARTMIGQVSNRVELPSSALPMWAVPVGKPLGYIQIPGKAMSDDGFSGVMCWAATFSADGRYLATSESQQSFGLRGRILSNDTIRIWEVASTREIAKIVELPNGAQHLAFSPDGRFLASTHGELYGWRSDSRGTTLVWDAATGKQLADLNDRSGQVTCTAFAPDSQSLVSGHFDYTMFAWDIRGIAPKSESPKNLSAAELNKAWEDLAGVDAFLAYRTVHALIAAAGDSVPFLTKQMQPVPPVDRKRIEPLINDLNSDIFTVRMKASRELESMGEITESALRQALTRKGSLEYRRRIENLLQKLNQPPSGTQLRFIRALTVLERISSDESRKLVQALAGGAPEGRLTQEARAVLLRRPSR